MPSPWKGFAVAELQLADFFLEGSFHVSRSAPAGSHTRPRHKNTSASTAGSAT
jgi:hypothetical protein